MYEAIPAEAMVPRRTAERPDVYLLYHPHYPSNIGHVLGDDFFPLFNLQLSFNMLSNDNQLLMVRSCEDIFLPGAPKKAAACHKFMQMLTPGMSDRPFLAATQSDLRERLGMKADAQLVCFENVLTGNGPWGFQQSLGKSPAWWQYHAYYLSNMGVPYNHTPKKHRITVSIKDGKRSIYNSAEMVQHLKQAFPKPRGGRHRAVPAGRLEERAHVPARHYRAHHTVWRRQYECHVPATRQRAGGGGLLGRAEGQHERDGGAAVEQPGLRAQFSLSVCGVGSGAGGGGQEAQ